MTDRFAARRHRVLEQLPAGHAMLLLPHHHHLRNGDAEFRYRQCSDILYLTGWGDPECAVLLRPGTEEPFVLFVQEKNLDMEIWTGIRKGPDGAKAEHGADAAYTWKELEDKLGELLIGFHTLYYAAGRDADYDRRVLSSIARKRKVAERKHSAPVPDSFVNPGRILHELRLFKDDAELELMRRAGGITGRAFVAAMETAAPGVHEYELEALIDYTFRKEGGNGPGYTSIVGGGANACILHYITNREALNDGDLVLIDAGCELDWYTADVTRTFPVNGTFSEAQKELYNVVLEAQLACIDRCRAGSSFKSVHELAVRKLTEGLVALGLLEGEVDALIADESYKKYYMHGTGHWLGMDVHDVGSYLGDEGSRPLEPGMVLTIEPGLYVMPDDETAPERFRGLGIRIEDDVAVTDGEPDVLTAGIPKTIAEVEAACAG